jgi:sugar phosphate isomerase/epimerase
MTDTCRFFIGNQTAFCAPLTEPFAFAVDHHFDAFELFPDSGPTGGGWSARDVTAEQRRYFRATAEARGIRLSVHAALEAGLLEASRDGTLGDDIDLARDLGAQVLNLHLASDDVDGCCRAALTLLEVLRPLGITLALENTPTVGPDEVNQLFARLPRVATGPAGGVGLCLDIGHANLCPDTHNDYLAYVDRLGSHVPIVHAHLHENWGDGDKHLTLFTGPSGKDASGVVGLLARLRRRHFRGSLILEQWPTPASLLTVARDRLFAIAESLQGVASAKI